MRSSRSGRRRVHSRTLSTIWGVRMKWCIQDTRRRFPARGGNTGRRKTGSEIVSSAHSMHSLVVRFNAFGIFVWHTDSVQVCSGRRSMNRTIVPYWSA